MAAIRGQAGLRYRTRSPRLQRVWPLLAVVVIAAIAVLTTGGRGAGVSVYPAAGTPVASPTTQISFRGIAPKDLTGVRVKGSRSGAHRGRLVAHSDGRGASFLPDQPFAPGETVKVSADRSLVGEKDGAVSFKTYTPVPGLHLNPKPDAGGVARQSEHFRTEPGLLPAAVRVLAKYPGTAQGYLMAGRKTSRGQDGAMIADTRGRLVWFHPAPTGTSIYDFRAQRYRGRPVLTWWEGRVLFAKGYGQDVIYGDSYRPVATVRAANGYQADLHEFQLTSRGTAYITAFQPVTYDLSAVGGPKHGAVFDSVVQEIDIRTGLVVFEWHGIGHIPFTDSYSRFSVFDKSPYDPFHVNSVDDEPDGKLLISARNTNAAYELDHSTGKTRWRLGGKRSSFAMAPGTTFIAQHDVRHHGPREVTIFDNGSGIPEAGSRPARGLVLDVNRDSRKVSLVYALERPQPVSAPSQGNVQELADGHYFVGWGGSAPYMSEFGHDGRLLFDASFVPATNNSYTSYRLPWRGRPAYPPKVASVALFSGGLRIWASWNGATDVASWDVLAGPAPGALSRVAGMPSTGFESTTTLPSVFRYVAVRARARDGRILGSSAPAAVRP